MSIALEEKRILITREEKQAKYFSDKVKKYGGIPVVVPLLKITGVDKEENLRLLKNWKSYEWIFFTSANGVHYFFQLLKKYSINITSIETKKMAAVGHKTEDVLKKYSCQADFIPTVYDADTMASEFLSDINVKGPILIVRGSRSREVLPHVFSDHEIPYDMATVYQTVYNTSAKRRLNEVLNNGIIDYITFTSPSTVEAFVEMAEEEVDKQCVCIGTTTEKRARELGFTSLLTPKQFTVDAMIEILSEYIARKG